jgi:hypothetical protein
VPLNPRLNSPEVVSLCRRGFGSPFLKGSRRRHQGEKSAMPPFVIDVMIIVIFQKRICGSPPAGKFWTLLFWYFASGGSILKEPSPNPLRQAAGYHLMRKKFYRSKLR